MDIFYDREEGGKQLLLQLTKYKDTQDTIVIGLPRGGVVTAFQVATGLNLPLDVIFPRKVGAPFNPELALGAVTELGESYFNEDLLRKLNISESYLQREIKREKEVAQERLRLYRKVCPKIPLNEKTVILIDDGLATGATMKAAIKALRHEGASKIIVAVPVAPEHTAEEIRHLADDVIVLKIPPYFEAVGQFYRHFEATQNEEVLDLLKKNREG